jgi:hypothetical protein
MIRACLMLALAVGAAALALAPVGTLAQQPQSKKAETVKAGKGEKVCRYRFPSGEQRSWVCKTQEPCCAWDAFSYVKCGSTITGCL